ncbi:MAG: glycosyltransferase family 2 protein, partial [Candidatus Sulfotelmatobacter sp.]
MTWVFWVSAFLIAYTYVGYAAWLWLQAQLFPWPVMRMRQELPISIVMVVRNEERVLEDKLGNLLSLDYSPELCQIVIVSDGSTDRTEEILREHVDNPRVQVVMNQLSRGKASGLNDAFNLAHGDLVIFTDARQKIEPGALRVLAESFADPDVGCVSGELMLGDLDSGETGRGMGLYWRIEKQVRELEAASGSVVGATGALYAVRRDLLTAVPEGTILDDVYIPMQVVKQGKRVVFEPRARAWDSPDLGGGLEFARKVRTLSGNYQL